MPLFIFIRKFLFATFRFRYQRFMRRTLNFFQVRGLKILNSPEACPVRDSRAVNWWLKFYLLMVFTHCSRSKPGEINQSHFNSLTVFRVCEFVIDEVIIRLLFCLLYQTHSKKVLLNKFFHENILCISLRMIIDHLRQRAHDDNSSSLCGQTSFLLLFCRFSDIVLWTTEKYSMTSVCFMVVLFHV
jgi:hypothetical protein